MSHESSQSTVHVGRDGWLFLTGGANAALRFYTTTDFSTIAPRWLELLIERKRRCAALGTKYYHLIAPEKLTVYPDKYDGPLSHYNETPAIKLPALASGSDIGQTLIEAASYLRLFKKEEQLYWKTDTHWTPLGCFRAYEALCRTIGIDPAISPVGCRRDSLELELDLGAKLNPPVKEEFYILRFQSHFQRVAANAIVNYKERMSLENEPGLHVGSNVVFTNYHERASHLRVVLFGDSFCEYRPHLMTGMLAETVRELHFIWSSELDWYYIEKIRPDIVISEVTERFMGRLPTDSFDVNTHAIKTVNKYLTT